MSNPTLFHPLAPAFLSEVHRDLKGVGGWLSRREIQFLAMAAANPTAEGEILESGSFEGKSTIVLAKAVRLADGARVTTMDPDDRPEFHANIARAGVADGITKIHGYSTDQIAGWDKPLRMLFLDGANDIDTVRSDVDGFLPHLRDRGIIAFHDVLNRSGDRIYVYLDRILGSPHFGPVGVCGSLGWAQYFADPTETAGYALKRERLANRLRRLLRFHTTPRKVDYVTRNHYKLLRYFVPHGPVDEQAWFRRVAA